MIRIPRFVGTQHGPWARLVHKPKRKSILKLKQQKKPSLMFNLCIGPIIIIIINTLRLQIFCNSSNWSTFGANLLLIDTRAKDNSCRGYDHSWGPRGSMGVLLQLTNSEIEHNLSIWTDFYLSLHFPSLWWIMGRLGLRARRFGRPNQFVLIKCCVRTV